MFIYVSYDNQQQCYGVKKLFLEHNHPYRIEEFSMYSSQHQAKGLLQQQTLMLIEHGANTAFVTDSLNRSSLKTKPRDVYNIKQKLKFKGSLYHIDANSDGQVNNLSMPLYTLAVVDQHGMGQPLIQSIVYRKDQAHLRMFLIRSQEWDGFNTFSTSIFVIDKIQAEISVLQAVFPDNHILLCRFQVSKAFVHEIKKSNLISNDKESLYKAMKRLLYGNQQTFDEALLNIQGTFPEFYTYLTNNWLMMADMFMGYKRKGLLHINNHTNNRLELFDDLFSILL
ncbi:uncharacterized protein LOC136079234 [Hydra vulgaris]|uniref:Uncharacterized protein LOC136079234 n=1 Tax=Hydra vulgaris TaxID=6087 RepID=A0ABM4BPI8_HYDVU